MLLWNQCTFSYNPSIIFARARFVPTQPPWNLRGFLFEYFSPLKEENINIERVNIFCKHNSSLSYSQLFQISQSFENVLLITKVWNYNLLQQHFCMFSFFLSYLLFFPPSICRCPICHTNNSTVSILYLEIFLFLLTGLWMLLNHQTNPLVAHSGRCH